MDVLLLELEELVLGQGPHQITQCLGRQRTLENARLRPIQDLEMIQAIPSHQHTDVLAGTKPLQPQQVGNSVRAGRHFLGERQ